MYLFLFSVPYSASCPRERNQVRPVVAHLSCLATFVSCVSFMHMPVRFHSVHVCSPCLCVCNVADMRGWAWHGFSCWDAKKQKKLRLSVKVDRVELGEISITKPMHLRGHGGYLFLFLWKRRQFLQVSWQPARGFLDTSSADILQENRKPKVNKLTRQISLKSCLLGLGMKFFHLKKLG